MKKPKVTEDENGKLVRGLSSDVNKKQRSREIVALEFIEVADIKIWETGWMLFGEYFKPCPFKEFVNNPFPRGLGTDADTLEDLLSHNTIAHNYFLKANERKHGGQQNNTNAANDHKTKHNNVMVRKAPQGNSIDYALRKLRTDAPEIHAKVIVGELSSNAGMILAGLKQPSPTVSVGKTETQVEAFIRYINNHFDDTEKAQIKEGISVCNFIYD